MNVTVDDESSEECEKLDRVLGKKVNEGICEDDCKDYVWLAISVAVERTLSIEDFWRDWDENEGGTEGVS